jgi:hypothetical protein
MAAIGNTLYMCLFMTCHTYVSGWFLEMSKDVHINVYPVGLCLKIVTIIKCQLMPSHSEKVTFREHFILNFVLMFAVISFRISKVGSQPAIRVECLGAHTGTSHASSVHRALQEQ